MSFLETCVLVALMGTLSHLLYFRHGEHLKASPSYVVCAILAPMIVFLFLFLARGNPFVRSCLVTAALYWSFLAGVFSSTAIYRVFFHPLRKFDGPFWARVTQTYLPFHASERADSAWFIDSLHQKYGEYFRLGPNLLSIADPDMVGVIHAPGTKFGKGQWYDVGKPLTTIQQIREKHVHDARRKDAWDPAFTTKSLRNYDPRILKHTHQLVEHLQKTAGEKVNVSQWFNFFAFDVMGDLGFGRHFNLLESGKPHLYMDLVHENGRAFGVMGSMSWLLHCMMTLIPESMTPMSEMLRQSRKAIEWRKANEPAQPDIMSALLSADRFMSNDRDEQLLLEGEVRLIIIAGSDTTATTLTFLSYYLARDPEVVTKLREELAENGIRNDETFEIPKLNNLHYLNALINETLRINPPVPGGLHRSSPAEGIEVKGHYIPGGIQVLTPMVSIMKSPKAFVHHEEFIPERWTTRPELILNKHAFFPFGLNSWSCVGKQLAYNEIRTVIAKLVLDFDLTLAEGETGHDLLQNSQDVFTVTCAPLNLVFKPRKG